VSPSKPVSLSSSKPVSLSSSKPVSLSSSKPVSLSSTTKPAIAPTPPSTTVPEPVKAPPQPPSTTEVEPDDPQDEPIDENDPLWKAVLKIAEGDREKAVKMLEDPDALMSFPDVKAIMDSGGAGDKTEEDWEASGFSVGALEKVPEKNAPPPETISPVGATHEPSTSKAASTPAATEDDIEPGMDDSSGAQELDPREHLNIVFIGHVDAGKSTLSGSILYIMGMVDARTIERFEREAKQRNRESWFLAFILDTSEEERAKGKTVEVGRAHFETPVNRYTILDAPGHKNYVPNMIAGAAQADVGVLVISARKGEFETGFEKGGQTREHALLAKTLGVQQLVVVINKMDDPTVQWDVERYEYCVGKLKPYLKSCGFVIKNEVKFVPISALKGDNVQRIVATEDCPWWAAKVAAGEHNTTTPTLLSTLDAVRCTGRNPDGPLRMPCLDRYIERGCVVLGKIESGTLRMDDEIVIAPTRKRAKVDAIYVGDVKVRSAKPGENVLLKMQVNAEDVQKGFVICSARDLCTASAVIKVQLVLVDLLEHRPIFCSGYEAVMHVHTLEVEVTCVELIAVIDKGKQMKRPFARNGQVCLAKLTMPLPACVEAFSAFPSMGRVTLRDEGRTIAIGKIIEVIAT